MGMTARRRIACLRFRLHRAPLGPVILGALALVRTAEGLQEPVAAPQGEAQSLIEQLLGGSQAIAEQLDELDQIGPRSTDLDAFLGAVAVNSYPSQGQEAVKARRALLLMPLASYRDVLVSEMRACDLSKHSGQARAVFAMRLLEEKALGAFRFQERESSEEAEVRHTLESWCELVGTWWTVESNLDPLYERESQWGAVFKCIRPALSQGDILAARLEDGTSVEVRALLGFERVVKWSDCEMTIVLEAAASESSEALGLSLYHPGPGVQPECSGIRRVVYAERCRPKLAPKQKAAWAFEPYVVLLSGPHRMSASRSEITLNVDIERRPDDPKPPAQGPDERK